MSDLRTIADQSGSLSPGMGCTMTLTRPEPREPAILEFKEGSFAFSWRLNFQRGAFLAAALQAYLFHVDDNRGESFTSRALPHDTGTIWVEEDAAGREPRGLIFIIRNQGDQNLDRRGFLTTAEIRSLLSTLRPWLQQREKRYV